MEVTWFTQSPLLLFEPTKEIRGTMTKSKIYEVKDKPWMGNVPSHLQLKWLGRISVDESNFDVMEHGTYDMEEVVLASTDMLKLIPKAGYSPCYFELEMRCNHG